MDTTVLVPGVLAGYLLLLAFAFALVRAGRE